MGGPWITVVGIGDDGLDGLPEKTRGLLDGADLLVGGDRHQAMAPDSKAERLTWACGLDKAMAAMEAWRGKRVVVLATGDPMCFGAGTSLRRRFAPEELTVIPHVSVFSHAAARMGWSLPDCDQVTLHGRAVENIRRFIQPGVRIIALSWNGETPKAVAEILEERGFGRSAVTVSNTWAGTRKNESTEWRRPGKRGPSPGSTPFASIASPDRGPWRFPRCRASRKGPSSTTGRSPSGRCGRRPWRS